MCTYSQPLCSAGASGATAASRVSENAASRKAIGITMAPTTAAGKRICSTMKATTIAQEKKFRDSKRLVIGKYPEAAQRVRK